MEEGTYVQGEPGRKGGGDGDMDEGSVMLSCACVRPAFGKIDGGTRHVYDANQPRGADGSGFAPTCDSRSSAYGSRGCVIGNKKSGHFTANRHSRHGYRLTF